MHERSKLAEARHFLDRMRAEHGNPTAFALELSAFMGAARSILQYACKEATPKPRGQQWYDSVMADPLLCFFRDMRNNSVHEVPVQPLMKMQTKVARFLYIGDGDDERMIPYPHMATVHTYEFEDRPGEEVLILDIDTWKRCKPLSTTALPWDGSQVDVASLNELKGRAGQGWLIRLAADHGV